MKQSAPAKSRVRRAEIRRVTRETSIRCRVSLDGGPVAVSTGLRFFDHMLDQIGKHGGLGLSVETVGDLHIDEHHTVEDTALALGEAIRAALGDRRGIARYGHAQWAKSRKPASVLLPMDEALASCALDFSGRTVTVIRAKFKREYVGDLPTELVKHFFESFARAAGANLHLILTGENEHHMIEAGFKALARAIRMAVRVESDDLPTTKGVLE